MMARCPPHSGLFFAMRFAYSQEYGPVFDGGACFFPTGCGPLQNRALSSIIANNARSIKGFNIPIVHQNRFFSSVTASAGLAACGDTLGSKALGGGCRGRWCRQRVQQAVALHKVQPSVAGANVLACQSGAVNAANNLIISGGSNAPR